MAYYVWIFALFFSIRSGVFSKTKTKHYKKKVAEQFLSTRSVDWCILGPYLELFYFSTRTFSASRPPPGAGTPHSSKKVGGRWRVETNSEKKSFGPHISPNVPCHQVVFETCFIFAKRHQSEFFGAKNRFLFFCRRAKFWGHFRMVPNHT